MTINADCPVCRNRSSELERLRDELERLKTSVRWYADKNKDSRSVDEIVAAIEKESRSEPIHAP